MLQNSLAAFVSSKGLSPKRPRATDPSWDLLWRDADGEIWVAEVKSLTAANEERQLRLGLGQLLRYRHRLAAREGQAHAVLMVEHEPSDSCWRELCAELGVVLLWPDVIASLIP